MCSSDLSAVLGVIKRQRFFGYRVLMMSLICFLALNGIFEISVILSILMLAVLF